MGPSMYPSATLARIRPYLQADSRSVLYLVSLDPNWSRPRPCAAARGPFACGRRRGTATGALKLGISK